jgi:hypothetical protein
MEVRLFFKSTDGVGSLFVLKIFMLHDMEHEEGHYFDCIILEVYNGGK